MKIVNILKDGTRLDSMKDYVIPYRNDTRAIYEIFVQLTREANK